MSPHDIAEVTLRWDRAASEPQLLHLAIAERLNGSLRFRDQRASWIIEAVTCLSGVLGHPGAFASMAVDLVSRRASVTIDDLAHERAALLGALNELCGPLEGPAARSWDLAVGLFAEIVASTGLDPFRDVGHRDDSPR